MPVACRAWFTASCAAAIEGETATVGIGRGTCGVAAGRAAGALVARGFSSLMRVPRTVLAAFIVVLSVVGAFGVRNNIADVYICLSFGVLGYLMKRHNFPSAPLVLGVILGPLAEHYFMTSLANYDNELGIFVTRPISATILGFAGLFVLWALVPDMKGKLMRLIPRSSRP